MQAVLRYLFARFDERFDGAPTLLILDEAWLFLDEPSFAARIRQWLKTLRKRDVSVIFATQSLADIKDSTIAPAIIESCASRIFLPNPQATEPQIRTIYEGFGLNSRQIEIVATAQPKRDYYYQSRAGNRLFDLDLGPVALAFAGASTPQDQRDIDRVLTQAGAPGFAGAWLRHRGLDWAADLLPSAPAAASSLLNRWRFRHEDPCAFRFARHRAVRLADARPAGGGHHRVRPVELQNTLTAVRTLEQINNQINQLQNEAQMLMNQARNLATLDFNIVNRLRSTLATTERLIAEAQGLAYDVQSMDATFSRLYPEQYAATISGDRMAQDARERWQNTLNGLHTAMQMQAQVSQNLTQDESALADLVSQSQSATGALQAMRATNQLLALQAKQSIQAQQLQITQDRAASLEVARQAAATERAREVRRRSAAARRTRRRPSISTTTTDGGGHAMRFRPAGRAADRGQQPAENLPTPWPPTPCGSGAARAMRGRPAGRGRRRLPRRRRSLPAAFAGHTGPDEYNSLAELPPIPASFDEPTGRTRHERRDHHRPIPRYVLALHRLGLWLAAWRSGVPDRHAHRHRHDYRRPVLGHEPRHRPGRGRDRCCCARCSMSVPSPTSSATSTGWPASCSVRLPGWA